jgi:hypothetical protein
MAARTTEAGRVVRTKTGPKPRPILTRFLEKTDRPENGCWIWTGDLSTPGYGRMSLPIEPGQKRPRMDGAHRIAWRLFRGPIPDGAFVLHRCDVRRCVNPDHLFLGTAGDNTNDMASKHRGWWQRYGRGGHGRNAGGPQ